MNIKVKIIIPIVILMLLVVILLIDKKTPTATTELIVTEKPVVKVVEKSTQEELQGQISVKNYAETSFLALEYTKINIIKVKDAINDFNALSQEEKKKNYDNLKKVLEINEENFYGRYSKVFSEFPTDRDNIKQIDVSVKEILYTIKGAYVEFDKFKTSEDVGALQSGVGYYDQALSKINNVLKQVGKKDVEIESDWMKLPDQEDITETKNLF